MAEETTDPLLNVETNEFDSEKTVKISFENPVSLNNGSSTQSRVSLGDNARRNSGGKSDPPSISRKMVPRYLRASTGSCHDRCKYGKRHESEEMASKPLRITSAKFSSKSSSNLLDSVEIMVSGELKKEKVVKIDPSADTKRHSVVSYPPKLRASLDSKIDSLRQKKARLPNSNSPTKRSVASYPPEIIKREILSTSRKAEVPVRDVDSVGNKMSRTDTKTSDHSVKWSSPVIKVKTSSISGDSDGMYGKGRRNSDVLTGRKTGAPVLSAKKALAPRLCANFSMSKTTSVNARKGGRPKLLYRKTSKSEDSEKILHVVGTGIENDDEEIKYSVNEGDGLVSDNIVHVEIVKVQPMDASEPIPDDHAILALPSGSSPKPLSRDDDDEIGNEADEFVNEDVAMETNEEQSEKENNGETLRMETEKNALEAIPEDLVIQDPPSPSSPKSLSLSNSPSSSLNEEDEEISEEDESMADKTISVAIVEENRNKTLRKKRAALSDDKYNSPMKLKFRSGKTIDLQPVNNTLRRLKFRRARTFDNKADESVSNNNKSIKADESVSDNNKSIEIGNIQVVKENNSKTSRKGKVVVSDDKYGSPQSPRSPRKLFRSVKVVGSTNNSRRLGFSQQARVNRAEDGKSDSSKRGLRKTRSKDDLYGAGLSSRKVMLKHQDMQGKRDDQGLFNNVIEETASKLVESRKSKVKALVGAFETVISLQERKPAMRTVA